MANSAADFKWSPEAINDVASWLYVWGVGNPEAGAQTILGSLVKAQPVVALPPCPTCKGDRHCVCGGEDSDGRGDVLRCHVHGIGCPACNGSGVGRLVAVSAALEWLDSLVAVTQTGRDSRPYPGSCYDMYDKGWDDCMDHVRDFLRLGSS